MFIFKTPLAAIRNSRQEELLKRTCCHVANNAEASEARNICCIKKSLSVLFSKPRRASNHNFSNGPLRAGFCYVLQLG